ncbi:PXMP2/4 family protein 4-like isoform X2 [Telopea speciosissima]|uniref:PXMP2/4 family protein 4-like isoform X2 n=1 Tax=Telopea speciosissima TaxID=54955 RepID=UPI001CC72A86|nr:PXMP2/4 family protein 4-like isoform X2 [Telopea speciosissima]
MSSCSRLVRNGGKACLRRLLERRSVLDFYVLTEAAPTVSKQQRRAFARSPVLFRKFKESGITSPLYASSLSSTSSKIGLLSWYLGKLQYRPVLTKSITSALIYTGADLTSQAASEPFDPIRTLRMAAYGMLIVGPSLHFWFNFVSKILPKQDLVTTFKKIFIGQVTYGPCMSTVFFSVNAALQGENAAEIIARLKRDLLPTMKSGLVYWPVCDFVTFKFIPVHLQPLICNSFAYLWTIYLTYMASLERVKAD